MRPSHRCHHRFARLTLVVIASVLVVVATLNVVADPFKVWRPCTEEKLDAYKRMTATRIVRASHVRLGTWQVVLAGASRTEIGFDPDCEALKHARAVNIGLSGAQFPEIMASATYALAQNPNLETLVVEMDPGYLNMNYGDADGFRMSLFNPNRPLAEHHLAALFGGLFIERSGQTLGHFFKHKPTPTFTHHGLRIDYKIYLERGARAYFKKCVGETASWNADFWPQGRALPTEMLQPIRQLGQDCRARGVRLAWVIPPAHAARLCVDVRQGNWPMIEAYKRALAQIAEETNQGQAAPTMEVWDFFVAQAENTEAIPAQNKTQMVWHWEPGHFKKALGDKALARLFAATPTILPPGALGKRLTLRNLEAHLAAADQDLIAYIQTHPGLDGFLPTEGLAEHVISESHH